MAKRIPLRGLCPGVDIDGLGREFSVGSDREPEIGAIDLLLDDDRAFQKSRNFVEERPCQREANLHPATADAGCVEFEEMVSSVVATMPFLFRCSKARKSSGHSSEIAIPCRRDSFCDHPISVDAHQKSEVARDEQAKCRQTYDPCGGISR